MSTLAKITEEIGEVKKAEGIVEGMEKGTGIELVLRIK